LIDFSKLNTKDVPKLTPFPGLTVDVASSSSSTSSCSSSSSNSSFGSTKDVIETAADGEDQNFTYLVVTECDDKDLQVDKTATDLLQDDEEYKVLYP